MWPGEQSKESFSVALNPILQQHTAAYLFCVQRISLADTVLDIGCGSGYGSSLFAEHAKNVCAIDRNERCIRYAQEKYRRPNLQFLVKDIEHMTGDGHTYNVVLSLQVLEHMKDQEHHFSLLAHYLAPNGICVISTPNAQTQKYNENPYHTHEYEAGELRIELMRHFSSVALYGVHGNDVVNAYEQERKKRIERIFALDPLRLRRFIFRWFRIVLFNIGALIVRGGLVKDHGASQMIGKESFSITESTDHCIDLIAVCSNI